MVRSGPSFNEPSTRLRPTCSLDCWPMSSRPQLATGFLPGQPGKRAFTCRGVCSVSSFACVRVCVCVCVLVSFCSCVRGLCVFAHVVTFSHGYSKLALQPQAFLQQNSVGSIAQANSAGSRFPRKLHYQVLSCRRVRPPSAPAWPRAHVATRTSVLFAIAAPKAAVRVRRRQIHCDACRAAGAGRLLWQAWHRGPLRGDHVSRDCVLCSGGCEGGGQGSVNARPFGDCPVQ